ncbi:Uncharacterised protein [uncultured archaeon]|nr:Uncharacterised protein [uncultured archaeon]
MVDNLVYRKDRKAEDKLFETIQSSYLKTMGPVLTNQYLDSMACKIGGEKYVPAPETKKKTMVLIGKVISLNRDFEAGKITSPQWDKRVKALVDEAIPDDTKTQKFIHTLLINTVGEFISHASYPSDFRESLVEFDLSLLKPKATKK